MLNYLSKIRANPVDRMLIIAVTALIIAGLVIVYSATITLSLEGGKAANYLFLKQLKWVVIGIFIAILASHIEYHWWTKVSTPIIVASLLVMLVVH